MPKYTKLLTPDEYAELTLEEKGEYVSAMADLLKRPGEPPVPVDQKPPGRTPKTP